MKKKTAKAKPKAKVESPSTVEGSEAKAPTPKSKREAADLPNRELVDVKAIVTKKGRIEVGERCVVYETANAIAVWDRNLKRRTMWIARKRVLDLVRE